MVLPSSLHAAFNREQDGVIVAQTSAVDYYLATAAPMMRLAVPARSSAPAVDMKVLFEHDASQECWREYMGAPAASFQVRLYSDGGRHASVGSLGRLGSGGSCAGLCWATPRWRAPTAQEGPVQGRDVGRGSYW
jgi:hypothetical protein